MQEYREIRTDLMRLELEKKKKKKKSKEKKSIPRDRVCKFLHKL